MSKATIRVAYDGPALHDGSMDVRDLAPALLAVGRLCEEANRVLNDDRAKIAVKVRAEFTKGSFEILLDLTQNYYQTARSFLIGDDVTAAANLAGFLGLISGTGMGLLKIIRLLSGKRIKKAVTLQDGATELIFDDGEEPLIVDARVLALFRDLAVRRAAADVVKPLEREGIDTFEARQDGVVSQRITKADLPAFVPPEEQAEPILQDRRRIAYSIVSLAFKDDNKWRLYDGQNTISATITDAEFLQRVNESSIAFSKGDVLICEVNVVQTRKSDTLRTDYEIVRVIEHRSAAKQLPLPLTLPNATRSATESQDEL